MSLQYVNLIFHYTLLFEPYNIIHIHMKHSNLKDLKYLSHTKGCDIYIHNLITILKYFDSY